ncbi:MAG: hypothetical protein WBK76_00425 [Candidatus Saccharimonadales bacterium]
MSKKQCHSITAKEAMKLVEAQKVNLRAKLPELLSKIYDKIKKTAKAGYDECVIEARDFYVEEDRHGGVPGPISRRNTDAFCMCRKAIEADLHAKGFRVVCGYQCGSNEKVFHLNIRFDAEGSEE